MWRKSVQNAKTFLQKPFYFETSKHNGTDAIVNRDVGVLQKKKVLFLYKLSSIFKSYYDLGYATNYV